MRRSAVSVPSNVAEGQACGEDGRYIHHLRIALGSLGELSTQMEIARRLVMLPDAVTGKAEEHLARTGQVLHGLLRSRLKKRRLHTAGSVLLTCLALGGWMSGAWLGPLFPSQWFRESSTGELTLARTPRHLRFANREPANREPADDGQRSECRQVY